MRRAFVPTLAPPAGLAPLVALAALAMSCVERAGPAELGPQAAIRLASQVRQLPVLRPIRGGWIDPDELGPRFAKMVSPEDRAIADASGGMLADLGLWERGRSLTDAMLAAMATQVAGFYDPRDKVLFAVRRASSMPLERTTVLVHEGVHALQDQHGLMPSFGASEPGLDDLDAAQQAAIEGDATVAMVMGLVRHSGGSREMEAQAVGQAALMIGSAIEAFVGKSDLHPVIIEALAFPYVAGYGWIVFGPMREGGWSAVTDAMRTPPPSTEQILHPARRAAGDWPIMIRFDAGPELAAPRFTPGTTSALGERWHRFVFSQWRKRPGDGAGIAEPMRAAEGWGGDRVVHWREAQGPGTLTVIASTWDTDPDADEAEAAWRAVIPREGSRALGVVRSGRRVVAALGTATVDVERVLASVLATWDEAIVHDRAEAKAFLGAGEAPGHGVHDSAP